MATRVLRQAEDPRRPKRGNGEGSIYQREDGQWVGRIMLGRKANGRPDRPKIVGKTRGEVQRKLAALRRKADEGVRADPASERQTLATYLDTWLSAARTSTRPRTWERYGQIVRLHIVPTLGRMRPSALRADAIQALYADKLAEGLAPRTVEKIHVVLHRALKMAVRWATCGATPPRPAPSRSRGCRATRSGRPNPPSWSAWWRRRKRPGIDWPCSGRWPSTRAVGRASCSV